MICQEQALDFHCEGTQLFGVLSLPAHGAQPCTSAVVIVVGGPQYRAGSHRQFVLLARRLASAGHAVLRFDCRGMGDSVGGDAGPPACPVAHFERMDADIGAAMDALQKAVPSIARTTLWGLCDGASAALMYMHTTSDPRVSGLVLVNPWIRTLESQARTRVRHYYLQRLVDGAFWRKLLRGGVGFGALAGLFKSVGTAVQGQRQTPAAALAYPQRMAFGWRQFSGVGTLLLSEHDLTAREFEAYTSADPAWQSVLKQKALSKQTLAGADHTCSQPAAEQSLHQRSLELMDRIAQARRLP